MSPDDRLWMMISDDDPDAISRPLRDVSHVNVTLGDSSRPTLLHDAAEQHALSAVRLLLEAGAHVDARGAFGNTPLHYSLLDRVDDDDVSLALRAAGADPAGATNQHFEREQPGSS
jgi:ankyrin repeat protein